MWETFLAAHQLVKTSPQVLFSQLSQSGIQAISLTYRTKIVRALQLLQQSQRHGLTHLPFYEGLKHVRQQVA